MNRVKKTNKQTLSFIQKVHAYLCQDHGLREIKKYVKKAFHLFAVLNV